jgi:hypothetical protein
MLHIEITQLNNGWTVEIKPDNQPSIANFEPTFDNVIAGLSQINEASKKQAALEASNNGNLVKEALDQVEQQSGTPTNITQFPG